VNESEQPSLPQTLVDVFTGIASERGGIESFNTAQRVALRALVRVLANMSAGDVSKAGSIEALTDMLPPKAGSGADGHIDLSNLSDDDLATLERIATEHGDPGPAPTGSPEATIAEQNRQIAALHELVDRANDRARIAEQGEMMQRHMADAAVAECNRLRAQVAIPAPAATQTAPSATVESSKAVPTPTNVVPIRSATSALAFDPINSCVPPHLDARKSGWPEY
jgi:hypothetical protein